MEEKPASVKKAAAVTNLASAPVEKAKLIEKVTLVASVIAAVAAFYQGCEAHRSTNVVAESFRLHDRPWLTPASTTEIPEKMLLGGVDMDLPFKNVGTLPAQQVMNRTRYQWSEDGKLPPDYPKAPDLKPEELAVAMVGAGETIGLPIRVPGIPTEDGLNLVNTKEYRFYMWGVVTYKGPGDSSEVMETRYCMFWTPVLRTISSCTTGNAIK